MTDAVGKLPLSREQQRLVLDNYGFARKMTRFLAHKVRGTLTEDDLQQLVQLALTEAARSFDPTRGIAFASFAWQRVTGSVAEAARQESEARDPVRRAMAACADLQNTEVDLDEDASALASRAESLAARVATVMVMGAMGVAAMGRASAAAAKEEAESERPEVVAAIPPASPEGAVLAVELRGTVKAGVETLPERARRLIGLYYDEGRSLRDVAEELGVSYATVRRDHDEALDVLREGCVRAGFQGVE